MATTWRGTTHYRRNERSRRIFYEEGKNDTRRRFCAASQMTTPGVQHVCTCICACVRTKVSTWQQQPAAGVQKDDYTSLAL